MYILLLRSPLLLKKYLSVPINIASNNNNKKMQKVNIEKTVRWLYLKPNIIFKKSESQLESLHSHDVYKFV